MKDIERIQSTELAVQVQDANPANFAIEQEVAQLVGATVPQPTQPSADDARELGAQLLVFLRRALTPIQTALRTALADIYAHLDSRCTDYTPAAYDPFRLPAGPYDPMRPFVPRTLPNLLTALTAFSDRKISGVPEAADGISLVHMLCGSYADITELTDTNYGYTSSRNVSSLLSVFPALTKVTLGMAHRSDKSVLLSSNNITELNIPNLEKISGFQPIAIGVTGITKIAAPSLKNYDTRSDDNSNGICHNCPNVTEIDLRGLENVHHYSRNGGDANYAMIGNMQGLTKVQFGDIKTWVGSWTGSANFIIDCPLLIDLRFKSVSCSLNLAYWSPTLDSSNLQQFLLNFKNYIALRMTSNGSGKTLTLSQAVFSAVIEGSSPICDDIKGIIEDKGWKVQDTNNNIFPTT